MGIRSQDKSKKKSLIKSIRNKRQKRSGSDATIQEEKYNMFAPYYEIMNVLQCFLETEEITPYKDSHLMHLPPRFS